MSEPVTTRQRDQIANATAFADMMLCDGIDIDGLSDIVANDPAVAVLVMAMAQQGWRDALDGYAEAVGRDPLELRGYYRELMTFKTMELLA